ncbi:hypothetical protein PHLCEN_2v9879 [Hermanssonia centrifuga]|uniref:Cytochrome P450 n=1 Tax=Hermanssonia centrifuga TaxID=98765 RepID=A0A2R6NPG5_9APHY|nr:hypothetical protein PHLCEN_2v9879 [Hermanssonia centrifuga]
MAGELVGWNRGLGYSPGPHSPRFREFRRLFQHSIGPRKAQETALLSMQERSTTKLLGRLLQSPDDFMTHVRQSPGELILRLAYGYKVATEQKEDPLVKIAEEAMQGFSRASEPGAFLVDTIPQLKYLPEWFPGAGFKTTARRMRKDLERLYNVPYEFVKDQMVRRTIRLFHDPFIERGHQSLGKADDSFVSSYLLEKGTPSPGEEELIKAAAASLYSGLAHRLTQGDVYRGYYFPKGTIVWANIWSMLHDEKVYPEPSQFRPERYLDSRGALRTLDRMEDPAVIGFGFGRRICPGMFLALNSVFIAVAMILYVFDISKTQDENGQEIVPEVEYDGFISLVQTYQRLGWAALK